MSKNNKFSPEVRERAVRLVQEHRDEYRSLWAAVESIAPKIGCTPTTLLDWIKRTEVDRGVRPGVTTEERERIKALERENRELRRANEILKRSEEHTSELQSLMRISYAVFCLTKKKKTEIIIHTMINDRHITTTTNSNN